MAVALAGLLVLAMAGSGDALWWNESFGNCMNLSIQPDYVDTDISNFTMSVTFNTSTFPYWKADATGRDIRIVDSGCNTTGYQVPYLIEKWNTTGDSVVWFLANLTSAAAANYSIYYGDYGNAASEDESEPNATFEQHTFVWLLNESSGNLQEVKGSFLTEPQNFNVSSYGAYGLPDGAVSLAYNDSGYDMSAKVTYDGTSNVNFTTETLSMSAWVRPEVVGRENVIFSKFDPDVADGHSFIFGFDAANNFYVHAQQNAADYSINATGSAFAAAGNDYHLAAVLEDLDPYLIHLFVDGDSKQGFDASGGGGADNLQNSSEVPWQIGRRERAGAGSRGFAGLISMLAIAYDRNWTEPWFNAEYRSGVGDMIVFGYEVSLPVDMVINVTDPENRSYSNDMYLMLNVTANETSADPVRWLFSINGEANMSFVPNATFLSPVGYNNVTVWMLNGSGEWFFDVAWWLWDGIVCNATFAGDTICGGTDSKYILTCTEASYGKYQWDTNNMSYCKDGCANGECLSSKTLLPDLCKPNSTTCLDQWSYIQCYRDTDGVAKWNATKVQCAAGCIGGQCLTKYSTCVYGESRCAGARIVWCDDDDSDGYYNWSIYNSSLCNYGCKERVAGGLLEGYCNYHSFDSVEVIRNQMVGFAEAFGGTFGDIPALRLFVMAVIALVFGGLLGMKIGWKVGYMGFVTVLFMGFLMRWVRMYVVIIFLVLSIFIFKNSLGGKNE